MSQKKIALVTGANRGLGLETSRQLAAKGFKVYMACRDAKKGEEAVKKLRAQGHDVELIAMDVTKTAEIRSGVEILKHNGEIPDVLVNNAGVFLESAGPEHPENSSVLKVDPVIILKTIEINTMGPLKLFQALVPLMVEKNDARIINISSGMGALEGMDGHWPGYRMSKTALNALTKILSVELTGTSVKVNSVCPGWVRTDMGGENASRSVEEGVETTVWLATTSNCPTGGFYRDKKLISW